MRARVFGLTDVGMRRESNEDAILVDPSLHLYAVADGMGGHAAGEVASRLAIQVLHDTFRARRANGMASTSVEALQAAVQEANLRICDSVSVHAEFRGMGTTLVALLLLDRDREAVIGHVGDSRAYLLRSGHLRRLTSDHSYVFEQVRRGLLSEDAAHRHPMRNIVTRALGSRQDVSAELTRETLEAGDVFLLCSDGLNSMLVDEEIAAALSEHQQDPEGACRELVRRANARGGEDNTTVIVVRVDDPQR